MSIVPPEQRPLPDVPVNEQGLRQLEIWLVSKLGRNLRSLVANLANTKYLHWGSNTDTDSEGLELLGDGLFNFTTTAAWTNTTTGDNYSVDTGGVNGAITLNSRGSTVTSNGSEILLDADGQAIGGSVGAKVSIITGVTVDLDNGSGLFALNANRSGLNSASLYLATTGGSQSFYTRADGEAFTVYDGHSPIRSMLSMTSGGDVLVNGYGSSNNMVFDAEGLTYFNLHSGKTLIVRDASSNPIFTLTG